MIGNEENQIKQSVNCRDGPTHQRKCTDIFCCILYIVLIASVIFLAIVANSRAKMTPSQIQQKLSTTDSSNPLLAITNSTTSIMISISTAIAFSFILVVISFIIPSLSAYLMIPLILLTMLLLGAGFLYRYFGNKLPFISKEIQVNYASSKNIVSLLVGIAFLAGFVISLIVILLKQQRIKFIVACLRLAKLCFWQNFYMIIVSIILSGLSLGFIYVNIILLQMSEIAKEDTISLGIHRTVVSILILFQMMWTHGLMQSYSDFLFQSFAIHWYYNQQKYRNSNTSNYSKIGQNLLPSLKLSLTHYGTINFGWILAFIPESLNVLMNQMQQKCEGLYKICCCCHALFDNLSKYCYIGTIMYSSNFCQSSKKVKQMRAIAKHTFSQLYMIGNFYITLMKIFIIFTSVIVCYFLIAQKTDQYTDTFNLIAPLIITLLGSLQIANHFLNATGLVGDTIYFAYIIDYNCQSTHFGNLNAQHCPRQAYQIIRQAKISKNTAYD